MFIDLVFSILPLHQFYSVFLLNLQHYIHGSSQGQFIVETYIVIFLRILLAFLLLRLLLFSYCLNMAYTRQRTVVGAVHSTEKLSLKC